jgi:hypothetical protein
LDLCHWHPLTHTGAHCDRPQKEGMGALYPKQKYTRCNRPAPRFLFGTQILCPSDEHRNKKSRFFGSFWGFPNILLLVFMLLCFFFQHDSFDLQPFLGFMGIRFLSLEPRVSFCHIFFTDLVD